MPLMYGHEGMMGNPFFAKMWRTEPCLRGVVVNRLRAPEIGIVCQQVAGQWHPLFAAVHDPRDGTFFQVELPSCFTLEPQAVRTLDRAAK